MLKLVFLMISVTLSYKSLANNNINCSFDYDSKEISLTKINKYPFTQSWKENDLNYKLHIASNKFSELDDYIVVHNSKGHKITYPLKCK